MTKIYEALEHAKKAKQIEEQSPIPEEESKPQSQVIETGPEAFTDAEPELFVKDDRVRLEKTVLRSFDLKLEKSLALLYQNIGHLLSNSSSKIVQFISARPQEGVPEILREFAKLCSLKHQKKVLIIDIKQGRDSQIAHFQLNGEIGWREAVDKEIDLNSIIQQVADTPLYVMTLLGKTFTRPLEPDSDELNSFLSYLRDEYEFILIDTPSSVASTETLILAEQVDGLVLVVEAGKTRWQVVDRIKQKVISQGGNILGVILNKRRFPIPNFIYKYL
ncbi:MAG: hypothetical protein OEM02_05045 [Desulfobulbaceae bacterium]|nr:hypothetical protein [Desulfobulbaceae bacterium]